MIRYCENRLLPVQRIVLALGIAAVLNQRLSDFTALEFATLCRLLGRLLDE